MQQADPQPYSLGDNCVESVRMKEAWQYSFSRNRQASSLQLKRFNCLDNEKGVALDDNIGDNKLKIELDALF